MEDEIIRFKDYLTYERRYSYNTVKAYIIDIEEFATFCKETAQLESLKDADPKLVRQWVMKLRASGLYAVSVNRKISTVRGFYKWMLKKDMILRSPAQGLRNLRRPKRLPEFVPEDKMTEILDNPAEFVDTEGGDRDRLIIELFYDTGIRETELIDLTCGDVDLSRRTITVHGKGDKTRMVPISDSMCERLSKIMTSPNGFQRSWQFSPSSE